MNINNEEKLFNEFEGISKEQWLNQAIKDLNDASLLIWEPEEGLSIAPFHTREDLKHNCLPDLPRHSGAGWKYFDTVEIVDEKEANTKALIALNNGADGIIFKMKDNNLLKFEILLKDILLNCCDIFLDIEEDNNQILSHYFKYVKESKISTAEISGAIKWDPLSMWTLDKDKGSPSFSNLKKMLNISENAPEFRTFCISSEVYKNSGATPIKEISFMVSSLLEYLRAFSKLKIAPEVLFKEVWFFISVGTNYYFEIAKIKAFRLLVLQIAKTYNIKNFSNDDLRLHVTTSWWTKAAKDPYSNILRNTTEAMAGIFGGCTSLSILPHDVVINNNNEFSSRMARNISNILKEETYVDKVSNPVDGSYYIENLTHQMLQKIWENVQIIEKKGGFIEAFKKGYLQEMIAPDYKDAIESILKGKQKVIGTNSFKNKEDITLDISKNSQPKGWFTTDRLTGTVERKEDF